MNHNSVRGLASIIIPCWNQVEYTRQCVAALRRHTREPWELIVVDNGSTDDTAVYLAAVRDIAPVPVTLVTNTVNLGFPAAINQGLQLARGEYLVLLNNDVVVTDGWLDQLIALANAKGDRAAAEHGDGIAPGEWRPAVDSRAGSGDPRPALLSESAERHNVKIIDLDDQGGVEEPENIVAGVAQSITPGPSVDLVCGCSPVSSPEPSADLARGCSGAVSTGQSADLARGCSGASPPEPPSGRGGTLAGVNFGIGLVGPMSNYAAPPQLVPGVSYRDCTEMHGFARRWRDDHRGQWFTVPKLSGFCLLMKRAVYNKIGGLDERFGMGFFDDDDLAERARRAGFELAVAHDLFVHHFGSRTFAGNGVDAEKLLDQNAQRFAQKWGLRETNGRRVSLQPFVEAPANGRTHTHTHTSPKRERVNPHRVTPHGVTPQRLTPPLQPGVYAPSSLALRVGVPPAEATEIDAPSTSAPQYLPAPGERARVSLTMIVKDEEKNLPNCLESVRGLFDEIVIVDTGSTDRTIEIARSFGARVFEFAWVDDFAAARNEALSHATGDYAFWLDADDVVEAGERQKLEALLASLPAIATAGAIPASAKPRWEPAGVPPSGGFCPSLTDRDGPPEGGTPTGAAYPAADRDGAPEGGTPTGAAYVVRCACDPSPDGTGGDTVVDHIRLFPILDGVRWTYRVHEQILPALRQAKVTVRWTDVTVRHTGYVDTALRARKLDRDIRLLQLELEERPNDPFVLFNLGAIAVERHAWTEALAFLERSLAGSAPTDSIVRKLFALIARSHQMLGDSQEALMTCARGLRADPEDAELWFRKAVVHRHRGESSEAEHCWRRILRLRRPDQFCSVDQGIFGHLTRRNLANLAAERGDDAEAERLWFDVMEEIPGDREAHAKLEHLRGRLSLIGRP